MGKAKPKRHPDPGPELDRQVRLMRWRLRQQPRQTFADYETEFNHWTKIDRLCFELIDLRQPSLPFDKVADDGTSDVENPARMGQAKTIHRNLPYGHPEREGGDDVPDPDP